MQAKVISFASTKGGCGKSVLSDGLANYLARQGKKVLLIDLNSQMDLTLEFDNVPKDKLKKSCIYRAFYHDDKYPTKPFATDFKPVRVSKNISLDLMASSDKLRNVDAMFHGNHQESTAPYVLSHIFSSKSGIGLSDKYDYIIIDTHNDTDIPVQNAFAISDYILAPVIPSRFGINSVSETIKIYNKLKEQLRQPITQQTFVTAKLYFIGNLIKFNTTTSNQFVKAVKNNKLFIAFIHELELFNKAQTNGTNIFDMAQNEKVVGKPNDMKTLHKRILPELKKIADVVSK